jgi:alpha-2-macroglobulin
MDNQNEQSGESFGAESPEPTANGTDIMPADGAVEETANSKIKYTVGKIHRVLSKITAPKLGLVAIFCAVAVVAGIFMWQESRVQPIAIKHFADTYSFVPEKISTSASIPINVPEGVSVETLRANISFSPEIQGKWLDSDIEGLAVFKPKQPLLVGRYYAVNLDTENAQLSGDFYVDEDPQVLAVFPGANTESHEDTEITVVFNRPMVPLTTLSVQESVPLPITITPPTPGKFKWISTRNLQFVPETTLIPSSNYTVEIRDGMYSVDGLPIPATTHKFTTRPLRYEYLSNTGVGYRSPMVVAFNQPVDLEKTAKKISVATQDGKTVAVDIEYGERRFFDAKSRKYVTEQDRNQLHIYQKRDTHGRSGLWDFDTTYRVAVSGAVPLAGDKELTEGRNVTVSIPDVIQSITAQSEKTNLASQNLFDPEGTLSIKFYEDVEIKRSDFMVKGLRAVEYGETCKVDESGQTVWLGSGCEKVADKSTLLFSFDSGVFTRNETFTLELEKIVTTDGLEINAKPITVSLRTYPSFAILNSSPGNGESSAALNSLRVCTNSPLKDPGEAGVSAYITASDYIVYGRWSRTRYISQKSNYDFCNTGEYETELRYGLLPDTRYTLQLTLVDSFDQTDAKQLVVTTRAPEAKYTNFFNMQKQYNVTPPERTSLTYAVENLEYIDMHICRLEPGTFLDRTVNRANVNQPPRGDGCTQVVTRRIDLPKKYWVYNYFQIDLKEYFADTRGHYVLTFSHPLLQEYYGKKQIFDRTYVSVTNLAVGVKEVQYTEKSWGVSENTAKSKVMNEVAGNATNLYWVNHNQTLSPTSGASVTQYTKKDRQLISTATGYTNSEGVARVAVQEGLVGAVVHSGTDTAVVTNWSDTLYGANYTRDASRTYVYTDRPIYRPGQTVYIKGIDRIGFDGAYEIWNKDPVTLEVIDATRNQIHEVELQVNEYGTFNTEFEIPSDGTLGHYQIKVLGQTAGFSVEEYVPAAFKLEAESSQEEYLNGDVFTVKVQADYYFGVPLSEGTVSYSVTSQDYYFDRYTDEYFNFGSSWYYCYSCGYGDNFLFRGEVPIDERGEAVIERVFDFNDLYDKVEDEGSKLVTVSITAKDSGGRSVSTQKSFIVHKSDFYLGAKTSQYYTGVGEPVTLRVKTVDTTGKPIPLSDISRTVYKVNWETYKRQEVDGGFYYRSEKKLQEMSRETFKTDATGSWSGQLSFSESGQYEVHVAKQDSRGTMIKTVSHLYIHGRQAVPVPPNNNYSLNLEVQNKSLKVGDTASLLIKSPYEKAKALITVERGTIYEHKIVDVVGGLYAHEFPIKSEYAPNVYASVLLLSGNPEVKFGSVEYDIDSQEHRLSVVVKSNKTFYLPGEEVTLTVETKDHTGRPVPAEVSIAVADLSVLALKGNPKKSPATFFYNGFPLAVSTASNIKNILYEVDIPLGTKGGGGASPDDLAKKQRGVFKDTAYWEANILTSGGGRATVSFTLPDNLTTWQIESLGVTKDTKLGVAYQEFTTKKDLMAVPQKPRFVVPGDTFSLGAKVFNQSDRGARITVTLESDTLSLHGDKSRSVFIEKGEAKTVYFDAVAPMYTTAGEHRFTFTASDDTFVDSVIQTIAITPNSTYETVATANFTKADAVREYVYIPKEVLAGEGGLTVNANATLAVFMSDALSYMVTYPYGCSEQLASALSTIAILTEALDLPNVDGELRTIEHDGITYQIDEVVEKNLAKIYQTQNFSGGFGYYNAVYPNTWLTMHIVTALRHLSDAGFTVREDVIQEAMVYIEKGILAEYHDNPTRNKELVITAEYVLRMANGDADTALTPIVRLLVKDRAFVNEKISTLTLAYLAILTAQNYDEHTKKIVYDVLKNRIDIDGRGAYLRTYETSNYQYFENPIKNTALLMKVFVAHNDEHPAMANTLRWLLASRDRHGTWGGTHNTFTVVEAMVEYLKWQKETESHFLLTSLLGGEEIFETEFNPETVFKTYSHVTPIDDLRREELLSLVFEKKTLNGKQNNLYYDISLKYFLPVQALPPRDEGITITRALYALTDERGQNPIQTATVGEVVRGKITITIPDQYTHVAIEDMIPAGFEIVNFNLATEDQSLREGGGGEPWYDGRGMSKPSWLNRLSSIFGKTQVAQVYQTRDLGGSYAKKTRQLYPDHTESHDDRVFLFKQSLAPGVYEYEYFLRALVPGEFQHLPARAEQLFFPEVFGRTSGDRFVITEAR